MTNAALILSYALGNTRVKVFPEITETYHRVLGLSGGFELASDLLIAIVLCYYLYSRRTGRAT
jgi:hypothetical protein